jgi:hypothetical protein
MNHDNDDNLLRGSLWYSLWLCRAFLFRTMLIGFAFTLPCVFFAPTRRILRFIRDLEGVQVATELFQLAIVLTIVGLILQGLFYLVHSGLHLFSPKDSNGTQENHLR